MYASIVYFVSFGPFRCMGIYSENANNDFSLLFSSHQNNRYEGGGTIDIRKKTADKPLVDKF